MLIRRYVLVLGILAVFAANAGAGEKSDAEPKRLRAADCEKLVEQLVNPNKPPFEKLYVRDLPKGHSEAELLKSFKKIGEAYDSLSKNIEVALPVLMKHIDNRRYSFVQEQPGSGVFRKISVGEACRDIIYAHVEAHWEKTTRYDDEGRPRQIDFIGHCGGLDEWWRTRKNKSLAELQLEAIEWVLEQKKPRDFKTEKEWQAALAEVKKMANAIRSTKKPIRVNHRVFFFSK